ncbi:CDP-glycerol glycerophosphotransferase family protein (plasmid) [Coraliomargarita sp. W4R53]
MTIPLYAAGRLITLFVPRSKDEWVFGCGVGIADGTLALWQVAAADKQRAVWLVSSQAQVHDAAEHGITTVAKHSLQGFWRTARARVIVVTHGFGDVNRYAVSGGYVVQLWHGIPLKRIGIDSDETTRLPATLRRLPGARFAHKLLRLMYRRATARIDLIPAASHLVRGRLESAFSLRTESVPVTGEPRVDVLSAGTACERRVRAREEISALVGPLGESSVVLYAPTWRDGAIDPAIPQAHEWAMIHEMLERNDAILLVRSHPLGAGDYVSPAVSARVRALGADVVIDATGLLAGLDALITDYSSLAFDASLVPLPTVFFAPDLEEYEARRGFYGGYGDVAGEAWAVTWDAAMTQLAAILDNTIERGRRIARARELSEQVHAYSDGFNTRRVYLAILTGAHLPGDVASFPSEGSQ